MSGRPTKLADAREQKIIKVIRDGGSQRCAAAAAGIATSTLTDWLARGRRNEEPYSAFSARFKEAAAEAEAEAVRGIRTAGLTGSWQALAWWLERRFPEWRSPDAKMRARMVKAAKGSAHGTPQTIAAAIAAEDAEWEPLHFVMSSAERERRRAVLEDELARLKAIDTHTNGAGSS